MLVTIVLTWKGLQLMQLGRKLDVSAGKNALQSDPRAPVVYLRSFDQDADSAHSMTPLGSYRYFTEEEQLAKVLRDIGPCIAVGDPREKLPDLGADRIYLGDEWQRRVLELIASAQLIVLRGAGTEGLWWEFQQVVQRVDPKRVLLVVPSNRQSYEAFTRRAAEIVPMQMPEYPNRRHRIGSIRGFVVFGSGWVPKLLPRRRSYLRARFKEPFVTAIKLTLQPLFRQLQVPWRPPRIARGRLAAIATASVLTLFFAFVWVLIQGPALWSGIVPRFGPKNGGAAERHRVAVSHPESPRQAAENAWETAIGKFAANPELMKVVKGMTRAQVRTRTAELSSRGLRRLDDTALVNIARLMARMLDAANVEECAALLTGRSDSLQQHDLLTRREANEVFEWFDLVTAAALAEAKNDPPVVPLDVERCRESFNLLIAELNPDRARTMRQFFTDREVMSKEDICWAVKSFYHGLLRLEEPHRSLLVRMMVEP
jgi:hypothetical protein